MSVRHGAVRTERIWANSRALPQKRLTLFVTALIVCSLTSRIGLAAREEPTFEQVTKEDCFSCHAIDRDVVGPAWIKIADRYHHDPAKTAYLAEKIRTGGVGVWGKVPMPPHEYLSQKMAMQLATDILSLKGSEAPVKKVKKYEYKNTEGKAVTVDFPVFETYQHRKVVTDEIFGGFEKYNSYCFRCHGFDAVGGEYAPDLRQSLNDGMTKSEFFATAMAGREAKGMPRWGGFLTAEELNQIYEYVKARSLALIGAGRPPSKTD